jgi:hypothetical protein
MHALDECSLFRLAADWRVSDGDEFKRGQESCGKK